MLKKIKELKCAECGAEMVAEKKEHKHTNGHWNEYRKFRCGRSLHFSPNFMTVEIEQECHKNPREKELAEARSTYKNYLLRIVNRSAIDETFKQALVDSIESVNIRKGFKSSWL